MTTFPFPVFRTCLGLLLCAAAAGCSTVAPDRLRQGPASPDAEFARALPVGARVSILVSACVGEKPNVEDGFLFDKHPFLQESKTTNEAIVAGLGQYLGALGHPSTAVGEYICYRKDSTKPTRIYSSIKEDRLESTRVLPVRLLLRSRPGLDDAVAKTLLEFAEAHLDYWRFSDDPRASLSGAFTSLGYPAGNKGPPRGPKIDGQDPVLIIFHEAHYAHSGLLHGIYRLGTLTPLGWDRLVRDIATRRTGDTHILTALLYDAAHRRVLWGRHFRAESTFYADETWPFGKDGWRDMIESPPRV